MAPTTASEKALIRSRVRASRRARDETVGAVDRSALGLRLGELVVGAGARSVSCYLPVAQEPDPTLLLEWALDVGIDVLLPASRDDGLLDWVRLRDLGAGSTAPGAFGISEPLGERLPPTALSAVDLVIAPACAVDLSGVRLGWGRGYFDRTLAALEHRPPVFAVVYDDEVFEALPREQHDAPLAGAVTPQRTIRF